MSYLPELLVGQGVPLAVNKNIPVALRCIEVEADEPHPHKRICHVLINASGRPIGKWSSAPQTVDDGLAIRGGGAVMIAREGLEAWETPAQRLTVSTYALMELLPMHPSSLLAFERGNAEKWRDVGDNVGMVDIPLVYPHMLPVNGSDTGLESAAGLRGYSGDRQMQTAVDTSAGEMAYAALLEPMLEKLNRLVMMPNGFKDCGNPFTAYIRRGGL